MQEAMEERGKEGEASKRERCHGGTANETRDAHCCDYSNAPPCPAIGVLST